MKIASLEWKKIGGIPYEVNPEGSIRSEKTHNIHKLWTDMALDDTQQIVGRFICDYIEELQKKDGDARNKS